MKVVLLSYSNEDYSTEFRRYAYDDRIAGFYFSHGYGMKYGNISYIEDEKSIQYVSRKELNKLDQYNVLGNAHCFMHPIEELDIRPLESYPYLYCFVANIEPYDRVHFKLLTGITSIDYRVKNV